MYSHDPAFALSSADTSVGAGFAGTASPNTGKLDPLTVSFPPGVRGIGLVDLVMSCFCLASIAEPIILLNFTHSLNQIPGRFVSRKARRRYICKAHSR